MKKLVLVLGFLISQTVIPAQQKQTLYVSYFLNEQEESTATEKQHRTALERAIATNNIQELKKLLQVTTILPRSSADKLPLLSINKAMRPEKASDSLETLKTLFEAGLCTTDTNASGQLLSLLSRAIVFQQETFVKFLIGQGANPDAADRLFEMGSNSMKKAVEEGLQERKHLQLYHIQKTKAFNKIDESLDLLSLPTVLAAIIFDYAYGPSPDDLAIQTEQSTNSTSCIVM